MDITKTIQPGEMGSKQLYQQYGEKLVCVRYRIDKLLQKRYTTVELIVAEKPFFSRTPHINVWVKINYDEVDLRQQVKAAGAKWLSEEKVWEMNYEIAKNMKLKKRIIKRLQEPHG
ncbi:MAG: hypothetical protein ABFS08_13345 [Pseudomonadota bacterium]